MGIDASIAGLSPLPFTAPPNRTAAPPPVLGYVAEELPAGGFTVDLHHLAPHDSRTERFRDAGRLVVTSNCAERHCV